MSRFRTETIGDATLILGDCREVLETVGKFDALVIDPPYGLGESNKRAISRGMITARVRRHTATDYGDFQWDGEVASPELISQARALAKWQAIFGGNYYALPPSSCWLVWDKLTSGDFADCELIWTNMPKAVRRLRYLWNGCMKAPGELRGDHPTQKPIGVMAWVLQQLPPDTRTILDCFMGSGTTGVACAQLGLQFTGIEREHSYFDAACRRIDEAQRQPRLFAEPLPQPVQETFL
jgi:site-specific DNA-methyltransferase (adenine-specific)/modification methylase